ncbi:hypothetical protein F5Y18DRAFT_217823 [Xylariaceae sp. FL1019]|nr:hypothetical protein F5Y18DRAFT_217823 [Xylariaceae sp. FL1019]
MPLQFVDNSVIDPKARKLIRSHVMRGKNIGKTRTPRRKDPAVVAREQVIADRKRATVEEDDERNGFSADMVPSHRSIIAVTRNISNDKNLLHFPGTLTSHNMFRLQQLYFYLLDAICPPQFCSPTTLMAWIWYRMVFLDEAYFHLTIATSSAVARFLGAESEANSNIAIYHMSKTFHLLNQKLSGNDAHSDSTIAAIIGTTFWDRLHGDPEKAMVHLNGAIKLIELTGGIRQLAEREFSIAEKALRADIELALAMGSKLSFCSEDVPSHYLIPNLREYLQKREFEPILYQSAYAGLREVSLDIIGLAHVLRDQEGRRQKLDVFSFQGTMVSLGYRLLEAGYAPNDPNVITTLDDLIYLSLMSFLITTWIGVGRKIIMFPTLFESFRLTAQNICVDTEPGEVLLWAFIIGRVSVLSKTDDTWLIPKVRKVAQKLKLHSWAETTEILNNFPWIKALHNKEGQSFWYAVMRSC